MDPNVASNIIIFAAVVLVIVIILGAIFRPK